MLHLEFGKGYSTVQKVRLKLTVESEDSATHVISAGATGTALTWTFRNPGVELFYVFICAACR